MLMGSGTQAIAAFFPFTALNPLNMGGGDFQWIGMIANIVLGLLFWGIGCIAYKGKELKF